MEEQHPDMEFKVIGYGSGEKFLKNPPGNLEYLGAMKYEDIAKYIAKCHMGISLRTDDEISREAFPVKVFEYMGVGIPMVVTPQGEASSLIENEGIGVGCANEVKAIIAGISSLKESHMQAKLEHFSRQDQSKRILQILI